jgi:hypothetical protein
MLRIGDNTYRLCLLDTMALSEMAKSPDPIMANFLRWSQTEPLYIPCFTVYSVMEIRSRPELFELFIERFAPWPCVLLKGYAHLLEEEVASYPHPDMLDPIAIAFTPLGSSGNMLANLPGLLEVEDLARNEAEWKANREAIVDGMTSLVANYQPRGAKFTAAEIRRFAWMTAFSQLFYHHPEFTTSRVDSGHAVDVDAFPTLKAMAFTVFYKFYADRTRAAHVSDVFDVLIAAALPYVDAVVTEVHMAESLRKIARIDDFLQPLDVLTLRDLRASHRSEAR